MTDASDSLDLARPTEGDVVDLILDDHRRFEALLRDLRDVSADRDAVRRAFAEERNRQLDADCGRVENVRTIVARAGRAGLLSED